VGKEIMKEQKPLTSGPGEGQGPAGPASDNGAHRGMGQRPQVVGSAEQVPLRPRPMMQTDIQTRKRRGRLGRDVQTKLGKTLQAYFDDVVKEGVPDRFKELLQEYDERKDKGSS
jgi:Anti-sigma factor NepR